MSIRARMKSLLVVGVAAAAVPISACRESKTYEATVEVTRIASTHADENGHPITADIEFSYIDCPGVQIEVIRGGKEFASCIQQKVKVGDKVKVKLEHHWHPEGHYDFDVFDVSGCPRPLDPSDEASYKIVRECSDWNINGVSVGFQCNYAGKKDLDKQCPWFKKH